eukprot:3805183-Amphidinium_carterae.1
MNARITFTSGGIRKMQLKHARTNATHTARLRRTRHYVHLMEAGRNASGLFKWPCRLVSPGGIMIKILFWLQLVAPLWLGSSTSNVGMQARILVGQARFAVSGVLAGDVQSSCVQAVSDASNVRKLQIQCTVDHPEAIDQR